MKLATGSCMTKHVTLAIIMVYQCERCPKEKKNPDTNLARVVLRQVVDTPLSCLTKGCVRDTE